jgi:hypothetical protein
MILLSGLCNSAMFQVEAPPEIKPGEWIMHLGRPAYVHRIETRKEDGVPIAYVRPLQIGDHIRAFYLHGTPSAEILEFGSAGTPWVLWLTGSRASSQGPFLWQENLIAVTEQTNPTLWNGSGI